MRWRPVWLSPEIAAIGHEKPLPVIHGERLKLDLSGAVGARVKPTSNSI